MITVPLIVSAFALACLTQVVKGTIVPKWGATGVHVFMFIIAILGVLVVGLFQTVPTFATIVTEGLALLATAITMYEVLLSKVGFN